MPTTPEANSQTVAPHFVNAAVANNNSKYHVPHVARQTSQSSFRNQLPQQQPQQQQQQNYNTNNNSNANAAGGGMANIYHRPVLAMPPVILMGGELGVGDMTSPIIEMPPSPAPSGLPIVEYPDDDEYAALDVAATSYSTGAGDRFCVEVRIYIIFVFFMFHCFLAHFLFVLIVYSYLCLTSFSSIHTYEYVRFRRGCNACSNFLTCPACYLHIFNVTL